MKRILMFAAAFLSVAVFLSGCVADKKGPSEFESIDDPAELSEAINLYVARFDSDPQLREDRFTSMTLVAYGCLARQNLEPEKYWTLGDFPEQKAVQICSNQQFESISANVYTIESVGRKTPPEYGRELVDQALSFAISEREKTKHTDPIMLLAWAKLQGKIARYENEARDRASVPR